jgi:hypothetical protein
MMSLFLAFHVHAARRGDGLLPEFLRVTPQPRDAPKPANEYPATQAEEMRVAPKPGPQVRRGVRRPVVL